MSVAEREGGLATFLEVLLECSGARRVVLWRLDRAKDRWLVDERVVAKGWRGFEEPLSAEGHPFTWAVREDLVLQVLSSDLIRSAPEGEWSLVAPVRDRDRVLCLSFTGPPGVSARSALDPTVRHLRALAAGTQSREERDEP